MAFLPSFLNKLFGQPDFKRMSFFLSQMNIMDSPIYLKEFFSFFLSSFLPFLNKLFGQPNMFKRISFFSSFLSFLNKLFGQPNIFKGMNFLSVSLSVSFFLPFSFSPSLPSFLTACLPFSSLSSYFEMKEAR